MNIVLTDPCVSGKCQRTLASLGFTVVRLPSFRGLLPSVSAHPDLLSARLPDGRLLLSLGYYGENRSLFDSLGVELCLTEERLSAAYPGDVLFDALGVGNTLYGREGAVSRVLRDAYSRFVPVRQGYARCSAALLSDTCAVTADEGLYRALTGDGLSVLKIAPGGILLPGFDTGFIGGAGGRLPDGRYAFLGDIRSHPDGERILAFAEKNEITLLPLSDEPLRDGGGLIFL